MIRAVDERYYCIDGSIGRRAAEAAVAVVAQFRRPDEGGDAPSSRTPCVILWYFGQRL